MSGAVRGRGGRRVASGHNSGHTEDRDPLQMVSKSRYSRQTTITPQGAEDGCAFGSRSIMRAPRARQSATMKKKKKGGTKEADMGPLCAAKKRRRSASAEYQGNKPKSQADGCGTDSVDCAKDDANLVEKEDDGEQPKDSRLPQKRHGVTGSRCAGAPPLTNPRLRVSAKKMQEVLTEWSNSLMHEWSVAVDVALNDTVLLEDVFGSARQSAPHAAITPGHRSLEVRSSFVCI